MQSEPFKQEKGKEQPRLVASQNPAGALANLRPFSGEGQRDAPAADVRVPSDHVGVSVMGVVLGYPPSKAQSRQHVRDYQSDRTVGPARREYLLVAGVVAEERHLGGQESQKYGDAQTRPGVAYREQRYPGPGESDNGQGHGDEVMGGPSAQQARIADTIREHPVVVAQPGNSGQRHGPSW